MTSGQSDPLRVKASRLQALAIDHRDETQVAGVCLDGTVLMFQAGPMRPQPRSADLLGTGTAIFSQARGLFLRAYTPAVQPASCVAAAPPDEKGISHFLVLGTANGIVQYVDLKHCSVQQQIVACSSAISDIAWIDADRVVALSR